MKTIIKNGTVVSGSGCISADILIDGEKIAAIGSADGFPGDTHMLDASGCLIFPGFIDAHTHFDLHVAGTVTADDFETGTKAAIRGGTTTIIDFATQYSGETLQEGLQNWHKKADGKCSCDYGFHMSISEWTPDVKKEIPDMIHAGIPSFKLYMTYDIQVDDKAMFEILCELKKVGGLVGVHCENSGLIAALQEEASKQKPSLVSHHYKTRPAEAEAEAIGRLLYLARVADVPVMVVHLTCREGLDVITQARKNGQTVYAETCPHYLLLNDHVYEQPQAEASKYVCAPPLRKEKDQEALWQALADGRIQTISTDHCSFTTAQKALGKEDFRKIPGGMPGVETRGILLYSYGVAPGKITPETMCRTLSENPSKLYGLFPRKGILAPGSDADLVIMKTGVTGQISADTQIQNVDYSPFEGWNVNARIESVFLRGEEVVRGGEICREYAGQYLARSVNQYI